MAIGSLSLVYRFSLPLRRISNIIIIEPLQFDAGLRSGRGALGSILTRLRQKAPVFQFRNGLPIMLHLPCLVGKCFSSPPGLLCYKQLPSFFFFFHAVTKTWAASPPTVGTEIRSFGDYLAM